MVNASLNWASIVGIVLAVSGAGLYFLRSFKPALARDYDVFFAAIGLLCGGILFFQGWRLDPILQFGNFLLVGTTVFWGYESVRLRGVATDQARRSSYFDEEFDDPLPKRGFRGSDEEEFDQFEEAKPIRRRFSGSENSDYENSEDDFYRSRRTSRAAIPEKAASRRGKFQRDSLNQDSVQSRRMARFRNKEDDFEKRERFGDRRVARDDQRRGSRPIANRKTTDRRQDINPQDRKRIETSNASRRGSLGRYGEPKGAPIGRKAEDAAFSQPISERKKSNSRNLRGRDATRRNSAIETSDFDRQNKSSSNTSRPRDNSSRFDD